MNSGNRPAASLSAQTCLAAGTPSMEGNHGMDKNSATLRKLFLDQHEIVGQMVTWMDGTEKRFETIDRMFDGMKDWMAETERRLRNLENVLVGKCEDVQRMIACYQGDQPLPEYRDCVQLSSRSESLTLRPEEVANRP